MNLPSYELINLITSRLLLRKPEEKDVTDIFEYRSDPEVMKYIPRPLAKTHQDVRDLLTMIEDFNQKKERINWVMEWKETGKVIGMIGFVKILPEHARAEVGYALNRKWQRQGITKEALKAVLQFGFEEMKLHTAEAIIDAENNASGALLLNAGFRQEAYFREDFFYDGQFRNSIHFGLLAREWLAKSNA